MSLNLFEELKKLFEHASDRRRTQFFILLLVMVMGAFVELINLGLVVPFVGLLISSDSALNYSIARIVLQLALRFNETNPILPMALAFGCFTLLSGALRVVQLRLGLNLAFSFGEELSSKIYRRVLEQNYISHFSKNSSEIVGSIIGHINQIISWVLQPILALLGSTFVFSATGLSLFLIDKWYAFVSILIFVSIYCGIVLLFRKKTLKNSEIIDRSQIQLVKCLQEGFASFRDILLTKSQGEFAKVFNEVDAQLRRASSDSIFLGSIPRIIIETLSICALAGIACFIGLQEIHTGATVQILAAMALGAQRALPALQQMYSSWILISGSASTLRTVNNLLGSPSNFYVTPETQPTRLDFKRNVWLRNIAFSYNPESRLFEDVDLKIIAGQTVLITGPSGSGKSTLLDILAGLLPPKRGKILVDELPLKMEDTFKWQALIAYVPQSIFLLDASIEENISLGTSRSQIDQKRLLRSAQIARVMDFVDSQRGGIHTLCGERGIRLSGGQRQRIGIARALYRQPSILILDEATNSIEPNMEELILKEIRAEFKNLTVLVVAHRRTNLKFFDSIYELVDGRLETIKNIN